MSRTQLIIAQSKITRLIALKTLTVYGALNSR